MQVEHLGSLQKKGFYKWWPESVPETGVQILVWRIFEVDIYDRRDIVLMTPVEILQPLISLTYEILG